MRLISGGVCAPKGFLASGINCGIKKKGLDLALIFSERPCVAAGLFTKNIVKAAPVIWSQKRINKSIQAILINSGNANCCNGSGGLKATRSMAKTLGGTLGIKEDSVLLASTGIIGKPFPLERIRRSIPNLVSGLGEEGNLLARLAIMTTDTFPKEIAAEFVLDGSLIRIGAMAKGAGMIHPDMATMLCFITLDAKIERAALKKALKAAVSESFHSVSVDGDTSTNDTVIALANGLAGNRLLKIGGKSYDGLCRALNFVTDNLARLIVEDGEGATKFVTIKVFGARCDEEARYIARFLSTSNLLKCALYGEDPNWGRIAAKVGSSGVRFDARDLEIYLGNKRVLSKGRAQGCERQALKGLFKKDKIDIAIGIGKGKGKATCYTTDLSTEYVRINAGYE